MFQLVTNRATIRAIVIIDPFHTVQTPPVLAVFAGDPAELDIEMVDTIQLRVPCLSRH